MSSLYLKIYEIAKQVPAGMVTTYGTIAKRLGNVRLARVVGYAMTGCKDGLVPCHRVICFDGSLSKTFGLLGNDYQKQLLNAEGIEVINNKVDLEKYLWSGE